MNIHDEEKGKEKTMKRMIAGALTTIMTLSLFAAEVPAVDAAGPGGAKAAAGEEITIPKSNGNPMTGKDENGERMWGGDPSILVDGDTVYLYVGHDISSKAYYDMPDWYCYSSTDMETWTCEGRVMADGANGESSITWTSSSNEAWAGQVMKHYDPDMEKDYYYFYHCTSKGNKCIGVGVADTPTGWSTKEEKAAYCEEKGITDKKPNSLLFVDIGHALVQSDVTWPSAHGHDDIDPTAWIETDENGVEHRYLAWGNSFCFIAELNEDMISIMDKDENGLITMKTTRSLLTKNGSVATTYQAGSATSQLIDKDYPYPVEVKYTDFTGSQTIPKGESYPDGDIICSMFRTYNTYDYDGDTPYAEYGTAVDNDGGSMKGLLKCDDDNMLNGLYTWMEKDGEMVPNYHFFTEAPWLYRRTDENGKPYGQYYLFFAVDWREQMAYATCDDLNEADWEFHDVIMPWTSTADTNHMAVFDFKGKTYFVYHNGSLEWGNGYRRIACVEELNFNEDGTIQPIQETATGLTGTTSWISDMNGNFISHQHFNTTRDGGNYPFTSSKAKTVSMKSTDDDGDSRWEIVPGKADPDNDAYVSIESWNRPGLYLKVNGTDVVLSQHSTDDYTVPSTSDMGTAMTFKTVAGLDGTEDTVSFESVLTPGMYLTSKDDDLVLSDGSDEESCTFHVKNRNALKSISAEKTTTVYKKGDKLDTSDIKVTATRQGGITEDVTGYDVSVKEIDMNKAGKKTITVTYREDNFIRTAEIEITVVEVSLPQTLSLKNGSSQVLSAAVTPSDIEVTWSSDNQNVATVDQSGKVTAKGNGTATITATAGGVSATCKVTVTTDAAPSVSIDQKTLSMYVGEKKTLKANASGQKVNWSTSNSKIATVKDGKVTAKKAGKVTITAQVGTQKATCDVTVKAQTIKLNKKKITVKRGKSVKLKATTAPKNAKVTWTTSKKKVATVKNGKVTGKSVGKAKITAKLSSGKKVVCNVTVK